MGAILKVRDDEGNIIEIPALKGDPGKGDMEASVYDPQGKKQDVFKYTDDKISAIPKVDAYTKAETLADVTKTKFGLGANAVPDDVFRVLSRFQNGLGNEYVWAKNGTGAVGDVVGEYTTSNDATRFFNERKNTTLYVGNSLDDFLNGNTEYVTMQPMSAEDCSVLNGKYIKIDDGSGSVNTTYIHYIHPNAEWTLRYSTSGFSGYPVTQYANLRLGEVVVGYVNSSDPNAYPIGDGYTYTALGQLGAKVQIATGSYTGTNTYGASKPNSLTFDFKPSICLLLCRVDTSTGNVLPYFGVDIAQSYGYTIRSVMYADALTSSYLENCGFGEETNSADVYGKKSADGKTLYWYNTGSVSAQFNASSCRYYYLAIG